MDRDEKRMAQALGAGKVTDVDAANLLRYSGFLLTPPDKSTIFTVTEDLPWNGSVMCLAQGTRPGVSAIERPTLRTDTYQPLGISEYVVEVDDRMVRVERPSAAQGCH